MSTRTVASRRGSSPDAANSQRMKSVQRRKKSCLMGPLPRVPTSRLPWCPQQGPTNQQVCGVRHNGDVPPGEQGGDDDNGAGTDRTAGVPNRFPRFRACQLRTLASEGQVALALCIRLNRSTGLFKLTPSICLKSSYAVWSVLATGMWWTGSCVPPYWSPPASMEAESRH